MQTSRLTLTAKLLLVDIVGSFVYFPMWWYTAGFVRAVKFCIGSLRDKATQFGILIWIRNLFVPMYGQYDIAGRLVSFFMRLVSIFYYSVVLVVYGALMLVLVLLWVLFPLVVVSGMLTHLSSISA